MRQPLAHQYEGYALPGGAPLVLPQLRGNPLLTGGPAEAILIN
jgi:hypothetical protein